jgi:hypothetical protein
MTSLTNQLYQLALQRERICRLGRPYARGAAIRRRCAIRIRMNRQRCRDLLRGMEEPTDANRFIHYLENNLGMPRDLSARL